MRKIISAALLVGGLILLYFGYNEYQSMQSEINEFFTGPLPIVLSGCLPVVEQPL